MYEVFKCVVSVKWVDLLCVVVLCIGFDFDWLYVG